MSQFQIHTIDTAPEAAKEALKMQTVLVLI